MENYKYVKFLRIGTIVCLLIWLILALVANTYTGTKLPYLFEIFFLANWILSVLIAIWLARLLKKSPLVWGLLSFLMPYIFPIILAFKKPNRLSAKSKYVIVRSPVRCQHAIWNRSESAKLCFSAKYFQKKYSRYCHLDLPEWDQKSEPATVLYCLWSGSYWGQHKTFTELRLMCTFAFFDNDNKELLGAFEAVGDPMPPTWRVYSGSAEYNAKQVLGPFPEVEFCVQQLEEDTYAVSARGTRRPVRMPWRLALCKKCGEPTPHVHAVPILARLFKRSSPNPESTYCLICNYKADFYYPASYKREPD